MSIKRRLPWPTSPKAHDAEVVYLGTIGTRQCDIDTRIRTLQAKRKHRVFVYEAGPCRSGLYRYLTKKGYVGWVIAPSFLPKTAGGLVEGAWAYGYPAKVSRHLQLRLEKQSKAIQDISWKAQVRRCKRDRTLIARGKHANQVVVAIARELVGFRWAIAKQVPVTP
jgi:hypothetical protein